MNDYDRLCLDLPVVLRLCFELYIIFLFVILLVGTIMLLFEFLADR